jgi:ABC-2 type transport system permease protein
MRTLLINHVFRLDLMVEAFAINVVLFIASFAVFLALLRSARRHGSLIQGGE